MPDMTGTAVPGAPEAYHDVITAAKGVLTRYPDAEVQLLFELQPKRAISIKDRRVNIVVSFMHDIQNDTVSLTQLLSTHNLARDR